MRFLKNVNFVRDFASNTFGRRSASPVGIPLYSLALFICEEFMRHRGSTLFRVRIFRRGTLQRKKNVTLLVSISLG